MSLREQKGLEIANKAKITRKGNLFLVPSLAGSGQYTVDADEGRCTCPDYEFRRANCKHIFAVSIHIQRTRTVTTKTTETDKGKITETVETETVKVEKRVTYKQDWTSYNKAQTREKSEFQALLYELCQSVEDPVQERGRPRLSVSDIIFAAAFKVYSTVSGRRFATDLREAHARGYLAKLPHYNSVFRYLESEALTPYLYELINLSSLPLKSVETDFAVDSSGFSTGQFMRWFDVKYGEKEDRRAWLKLHLMCGVKTHVVTSVQVTDGYVNDYHQFKPLVEQTARNGFQMAEVSADKAYLGADNLLTTLRHGARPYIPFKSNSIAQSNYHTAKSTVWTKMYHYFNLHREEFLQHYHKRSNVETVFSMIKSKFGQRLRSKSLTAQINEALCKVLCHNLCVLVQSIHELGIEATFRAETALAS